MYGVKFRLDKSQTQKLTNRTHPNTSKHTKPPVQAKNIEERKTGESSRSFTREENGSLTN